MHPTGAPPGHMYRHPGGLATRGVVGRRMVSPSSHRVHAPNSRRPVPAPPAANPRRGSRSSGLPQCVLRGKSSLTHCIMHWHHILPHPIPSRLASPHLTGPSLAPAEPLYRPPRRFRSLLPGADGTPISVIPWRPTYPRAVSKGAPTLPNPWRLCPKVALPSPEIQRPQPPSPVYATPGVHPIMPPIFRRNGEILSGRLSRESLRGFGVSGGKGVLLLSLPPRAFHWNALGYPNCA
jgi:hypothetical protein